jgi:hypothetical protein
VLATINYSERSKRKVMSDKKKEVRELWIHIRLNESEYKKISNHWKATTSQSLSHYARTVLLQKPVTVLHRNGSADEILAEMIRLKNELHAIGNNYNQAVHKLHTLDKIADFKAWVSLNEKLKDSFLQKTEEIGLSMHKIYLQWLQK